MTTDKEALFAKFLDYLHSEQSEQAPQPYLGEEPNTNSFDTYQMVAEWTALRHEVKQQSKLLLKSQDTLQQALEVNAKDKEQLQIRLEENQKQALSQFEQQQEKLLKDLLGILDALDRACTYWKGELETLSVASAPKDAPQKSLWEKFGAWFFGLERQSEVSKKTPTSDSLSEIITSNQEGVELIRRSLLEILRQRRVIPIICIGKAFDSQKMYAIGREQRADVTDNTVIQEVVRGYLWGDIVLREAQVIVATQETSSLKT